jgi:hypothetical protein
MEGRELMGKNKYTQEEKEKALAILGEWRGHTLLAQINSVSRSGMTRRIEFYAAKGNEISRIGYFMSKILEWPYDVDKGGFRVGGCGMDMIFHTIYSFNVAAWQLECPEELKKWRETPTGERGADMYHKRASSFFFPTSYNT